MTVKDDGGLSDAERRGQEVAREIGALQKQARELDRKTRTAKGTARSYRKEPRTVLFKGGATESSEAETADEAFRAADILRGRHVAEDEQTGEILRYKSGAKKGQPRFKREGTLKERNTRTLEKLRGKEIRIVVKYDKLTEGGKKTTKHRATRVLKYSDYDGLIRTYQDMMRSTINRKSEAAYYVEEIDFEPVVRRTKKPKKKKPAKRQRKAAKRAAGRGAAVRGKRTGKRGRRMGRKVGRGGKKSSRTRKRS